jgi:hypothetical protein
MGPGSSLSCGRGAMGNVAATQKVESSRFKSLDSTQPTHMARSLGYSNEPHIRVAEAGTRNNSAWVRRCTRSYRRQEHKHISQIVSKVDMEKRKLAVRNAKSAWSTARATPTAATKIKRATYDDVSGPKGQPRTLIRRLGTIRKKENHSP